MLLADRCACCGRVGRSPCAACVAGLALAPPLRPGRHLASLVALLSFTGGARALVAKVKRHHARGALAWLADGLAGLVPPVDLVTYAPATVMHTRERGVDHGRLLGAAVARRAGLRFEALLDRGPGPPQAGRNRVARLRDPPLLLPRYALEGLRLVVVDDVTTTGATLDAAGAALLDAGASEVHGLAAAATPPGDA